MPPKLKSPWSALKDGSALALRHPWLSLGICVIGMGLGGLAPLMMVKGRLPENPSTEALLLWVTLLPLDLYLLPRLVLQLDAETLNHSTNTVESWRAAFEARWFRTFAAKLLLGIVAGLGFVLLILPGLLVLLAFGWAPTRILLRGESLPEACRGSLDLMRRYWPPVVVTALLIFLVGITLETGLGFVADHFHPLTSPQAELRSPLFWIQQGLGSAVTLWTSTCLLALYQRLESAAEASANSSSSK